MKILMCHDGTEQTDKALRFAGIIAQAAQADVTLLGITETGGAQPEVLLARLQKAREALEQSGLRVEVVSKAGVVVTEIVGHGEEQDYDLVVFGAGAPSTMMPGTTYELARRLGPPALLVVGECAQLKSIVVCTCGKTFIEKAIREIAVFAKPLQAKVTLLHVTAQPPLMFAHMASLNDDVEALLASGSELGRNLQHARDLLQSLELTVEIRLRHGMVAEEVLREVHHSGHDMIVVGSAIDYGPLYRYMLGDVTREIVNRAPCPVWVSRQPAKKGSLWRRFRAALFERGTPVKSEP